MNKKLIIAITCISMLLMGAVPAYGISEDINVEDKEDLFEKADEYLAENYTPDQFVITGGPVSKLFTSVELDGPENQTIPIEKLLNRRFVLFSRLLPVYPVLLDGVDITIEYKRDVRVRSRYSFLSVNATCIYDENYTIENFTGLVNKSNIKHTIEVENFSGIFMFVRGRLFRGMIGGSHFIFNPAKFYFVGGCDKIVYS